MSNDYLKAYQTFVDYSDKISYTRISKVSYLLKLKAQSNSISDLDRKHKLWGQKNIKKINKSHIS
tara:strand:+ start:488 stop:682 length:195 start_codon:yes stop_codon:yes gene_type:complete